MTTPITSPGCLAMAAAIAGALLACPASALEERAAAPAARPQLDARALALSDTKRTYCTKLAPTREGEFEARARFLERGTSGEALAALRASEQYKKVFDAETAFLQVVPSQNGLRLVCAGGALSRK
jgi:hypothetical protein